ncbi:MAG: serine hydrolase [Anaerolineae bacterium]|nr:serine hydrolase [Anaerolineae bacterium]
MTWAHFRRLLWLGALVTFLVGCVPPTATPTHPPTAEPTLTPTLTPTWTPTPTATPTPTSTPRPTPTPTPIPFWDTRTSTPEEQGIDSATLVRMFNYIADQETEVHSVLIIRNGVVVTEAYFWPYNRDREHGLASCTKSFLSALIGIAVDEGYLDLDDKALDYFPDHTIENDSPLKREITVEDLLRMRSGLDWPESSVSYSSGKNILGQMMRSRDWVQFVLDRPMAITPGTTFNYSTGDSQLLAAILEQATGMTTHEFARTRLFEPLGVRPMHWYWTFAPEGDAFGGGGLHLTPRDMAKFGYLYLQGGVWEGEQVVPADWVEASVTPAQYGYQWWRLAGGGYAALGYGGQRIAVVPDLDLVVVITGNFSGVTSGYLVDAFVVPAVKSPEPLPENPEALAELETCISAAASSGR